MKKLIGSNFELDLSNYAITSTDENSWFSDSFSSKITYPFEIDLTDELDIAFGFLSRNTSSPTLYDVKYYVDNDVHDAIFEITEEEGGRVQASYEYGLEEFPLWETKLSELPLEVKILDTGTLYAHAKNRVNKVWPEVNYTFPAVHTSQFQDDSELWGYFEGVINNYQSGDFLENEFDVEEYESYNRNVMQPFVSFMYLMTAIAQTAGYTLAGDILTDEKLLDNFIFTPKEFFKKREPVEFYIGRAASTPSFSENIDSSISGYKVSRFELNLTVPKSGRYSIKGVFRFTKYNAGSVFSNKSAKRLRINRGSQIIFEQLNEGNVSTIGFLVKRTIDVEVDVLPGQSKEFTFYGESNFYLNPGENYDDYNVIDLDVTLIAEYSEITGEPVPTIDVETTIDLAKAVPDMTVGEVITALKNWHNYDYTIIDKQMFFNKIQNHMDFDDLISLEEYERKSKNRKFQQGISFLLKFADIEDSKFSYEKVFQDVNGVQIQNYKTTKKTNTIEINALPLPLDRIRNFETASAFENSETKLYIVRYQGLTEGSNKTLSPEPLLLPQIHATNYLKWFDFRINAISFTIVFNAFSNKVKDLNSKSKIFMYDKLHYIKSITKTQVSPDSLEVEIITESIK